MQVCLDTCHMFAAGYDISTKEGFDSTMEKFGEVVGWNFLCGVRLLPEIFHAAQSCS